MDVFFNNNITSMKDYRDIFFNMTKIRKFVEKLPVIDFGNTTIKTNFEKVSMVVSFENRQSSYVGLCNRRDSKHDVRVIADGFVYKINIARYVTGLNYTSI